MVATTGESERAYLIKLAEDYRNKGYEIKFQPDFDVLPEFLQAYKPDMLALGGNESVVVEVKTRPLVKRDSEYLKSLSQSVEGHPGWRFELVVLADDENGDDFDFDRLSGTQESLTVKEIVSGLQFANQLAATQMESAFLYAWSLVEATLRLLSKREEVSLKTFDVVYMIKTLVLEGVISRPDYQSLMDILPLRNAVAHGFKVDRLSEHTVDTLIDLTQNLLSLLSLDQTADE